MSGFQAEGRGPLLPTGSEAVAGENIGECVKIEVREFRQIDKPGAVLRSPHCKRDGSEMFGRINRNTAAPGKLPPLVGRSGAGLVGFLDGM